MFKRYLVACKQHHLITLIGLLILIVCSQNISAQQQIAQDAYAIFEQNCFICHGPAGSFKESLLIDHNTLIQNGTVIPGNPNTSELYNRLVTTDTAKRMPLQQPPLSAQAINTIRNWILAGAPDWATVASTDSQFISPGEILDTIETHLMSLASFDRAYARYFTLTHLYNVGETPGVLQEYRKGLSKLVNSLSWKVTVTNPEPIDPQGTIFYIDLRHYEWDVNDAWTQMEAAYPYHISFEAPTQSALRDQLGRLQGEMKSSIPSVHIDWFLASASLPPLYHELLSLPLTAGELETRLEVDVVRNLNNAPGIDVWRAGFNKSGVSNNNRMVERHTSRYGAYWKSYDFAGSVGTQNIFTHPLSFTHDGGEVIFNLPNGLQGYYLVNASGFRLDEAPINIVSNPAASDPTVRNGLSCMGCHTEGMKTFEDQVRSVIESNTNPTYDKAQALRLYVEQSKMDTLLGEDMERYRVALAKTGGAVDDIEPIQRFHEVFQGEVDVAYAAAVVGLETEAFLEQIRENVGLQNAGLLILASANGSVKRDAWTSSFRDIVFALNFPTLVVVPPVVTPPEQKPDAVVRILDLILRAAIAEALGKNPNAPITVEDMAGLVELRAGDRGIRDLTGLQLATNLINLAISGNPISDYSPLAGLIRLEKLWLHAGEFGISDLSPLAGLTNLKLIHGHSNPISDLSPLAGLTKLEHIYLPDGNISDLTPLAGLTGLRELYLHFNEISDISPLANLTGLNRLDLADNNMSDISPLAGLINLEWLELRINDISDLSPLAGLTQLKWLRVAHNDISDLSPLAGLTELNSLALEENNITDISPLAGLTNLEFLDVSQNEIPDISSLDGLRENIKLLWHDNPAFPTDAPKIEGPWLWVVLPNKELKSDTDLLSEASGGMVKEVEIATHGAVEGSPIGDDVWTSYRLPPTGWNNIEDMLKQSIPNGTVYGTVSLHSPREQETTMYVGGYRGARVWLNGTLIYERLKRNRHNSEDYTDFFPVTLRQGRNVLLVAVHTLGNAYFGFEPDTEYTVANPGVGYTLSKTPIHTGDTFTLNIRAEDFTDLAGWQFDIVFDPAALEAIDVSEGDFLKTDGGSTFFQSGSIDNAAGKITGLSAARLSTQGVSGTGTLLQVRFRAKSRGETELGLQKFQFGSTSGDSIPAGPHEIRITVEEQLATGDVNRDGIVSILDLILVAQQLGKRVPAGSAVDINGDGVVSILDLIRVAQGIAQSPAAPSLRSFADPPGSPRRQGDVSSAPRLRGEWGVDAATIAAWIAQARLEDDGSLAFKQGIENLQNLLASLIPEETALLHNYPNPFNPETWIPYQLAHAADVTLTIYDTKGVLVRQLDLGHQQAGYYTNRTRAAYWDGRNHLGEAVGSGLYFYHLHAGDYSTLRKMVILK